MDHQSSVRREGPTELKTRAQLRYSFPFAFLVSVNFGFMLVAEPPISGAQAVHALDDVKDIRSARSNYTCEILSAGLFRSAERLQGVAQQDHVQSQADAAKPSWW